MEEYRRDVIYKIFSPIVKFFKLETAGGILVLLSAVIAIIWSNSPFRESYFALWETKLGITFGEFSFKKTLLHWINDVLMFFFFLMVSLEIKREMIVGELSSFKRSLLPAIAALGGVILPIIIYMLFNWGKDSFRGWAIPMATDIAFTIAVMMLLGKKISHGVKVSITALAIVDDIFALMVIALFYSTGVKFTYVLIAFGITILIAILSKYRVRYKMLYVVGGILLWIVMFNSGIHPTIAAVLLAFSIPSNIVFDFNKRIEKINQSIDKIVEISKENSILGTTKLEFENVKKAIVTLEPPLQRFESALHPWVSFLIMPLFALANAGVYLGKMTLSDFLHPVTLGIALGLIIGKSTGIFSFSYLSWKLKITEKPNVKWTEMYGGAWLAGIGFTMALFISHLSFDPMPYYLDLAKVGVFSGSIISTIVGVLILFLLNRKK